MNGLRAIVFIFILAGGLLAQQNLYQVTVVSRTTQAVNYGHRSLPTRIDFKGTVLLTEAKGTATVKSERGSTLIDARFEHVDAPTRFGLQYLTYVVWALTPEGRAENLGELVLNHANKGRIQASTQLQAFAIIVTAEPHFAVTKPGPVVVMENAIRPDTVGRVVPVTANYEFLPPQNFTYDVSSASRVPETRKLSMSEYESVLALYQAQNAIQIARSNGAATHAAGPLNKAEDLYRRAQQAYSQSPESKHVVTLAREATQSAGDANLIASKRREQQDLAATTAEIK